MPDLRGMSLRKCIKIISSLGIDYKVNGCGKVANQAPDPGALISKNQLIVISCSNSN